MMTWLGLFAAAVGIAAAVWSFQFLTVARHSRNGHRFLRQPWMDSLVMLWGGITIPMTISLLVLVLRQLGLGEFSALTIAVLAPVGAAWANDALFDFRGNLQATEETANMEAGAP